MGDKKKKISGLPLAQSLVGLYTIGVNAANDSVRVSLEWLKTAYDNVMSAISNANRATESANTAAGKANKAATDAGAQMTQISQDASAAIKAASDAADNAQDAADNVQDGKTTQFEIGTVESGAAPSASLTDNGVDAIGNPKKKLNLVMQKGDNAKSPTVQTGTITTGDPASEVAFTFTEAGMTEDGRPIWRVDGVIPRGQQGPPGTGSGNVSADGTGLVIGKKYLFVPSSDDSTAGTFVEYVAPEIPEQVQPDWNATEGKAAILHKPGDATADTSGLMSADQFQKLEKLNPDDYVKKDGSTPFTNHFDVKASDSYVRFVNPTDDTEKGSVGGDDESVYLFNWSRRNFLKYTNAGKLLFEDKETFAVDADNELTLAGKKLSELGGGSQYLDLTPLIDNSGNLLETAPESFMPELQKAIENKVSTFYVPGAAFPGAIINSSETECSISICVIGSMDGIGQYLSQTFIIDKVARSIRFFDAGGPLGHNFLDLSPMFGSDGNPVENISEDFFNKIRLAQTNGITSFLIPEFNTRSACAGIIRNTNPSTETYAISITIPTGINDISDLMIVYFDFVVTKHASSDIRVETRMSQSNIVVSGDGTKFKTDNGTYKVIPLATESANGLLSAALFKKLNRLYTTATSISSLDVTYKVIYVSLTANGSLSASATDSSYNGHSITVYVYCSAARTITIPTTGNYVSMCGSSYTCPVGKWVEFNLTCVNGIWHIAKLEQE